MALAHEVPTGLRTRPTVTIRPVPGRSIRIPARSGTLLLLALLVWGALISLSPFSWTAVSLAILAPAAVVAALVELRPRGRTPLAWVYILMRHLRRPHVLVVGRHALPSRQVVARRHME